MHRAHSDQQWERFTETAHADLGMELVVLGIVGGVTVALAYSVGTWAGVIGGLVTLVFFLVVLQ